MHRKTIFPPVASPEEHERTPTTRKYATNAQINTPRVRFARFARLSQVATGSIFRDFKCVFTQKFTRLEGKTKGANLRVEKCIFGNHAERARTAFTARGALFLKVTPCVALPKLMVYSLVTTSSAPIMSLCVSRVVVLSTSGEISLCFRFGGLCVRV